MDGYLRVVIEESLADPGVVGDVEVVARKPHGAWGFLLVRVGADRLESAIRALQGAMARDDTTMFSMRTDPATWTPAAEYGMARGVAAEQRDFRPRTLSPSATCR